MHANLIEACTGFKPLCYINTTSQVIVFFQMHYHAYARLTVETVTIHLVKVHTYRVFTNTLLPTHSCSGKTMYNGQCIVTVIVTYMNC